MTTWKENNLLLNEGLFGNKKEVLDVRDFNGSLDFKEVAEYKDFYGIVYYNKVGKDSYKICITDSLFPKEIAEKLVEKLNKKLEGINYPKEYFSYILTDDEYSDLVEKNRKKYFYTVSESFVTTNNISNYTVKKVADKRANSNILGYFKDEDDAINFVKTLESYKGKKLNINLEYESSSYPDGLVICKDDIYDSETGKKTPVYRYSFHLMKELINNDDVFKKHFIGTTATSYYNEIQF